MDYGGTELSNLITIVDLINEVLLHSVFSRQDVIDVDTIDLGVGLLTKPQNLIITVNFPVVIRIVIKAI